MLRARLRRVSFVLLLALTAAAAAGDTPGQVTEEDRQLTLYRQHLTTLSNPFFEGRGPGTRGNAIAAEYFEFYFKQIGLKPAFPKTEQAADGTEVVTQEATFRQEFTAGHEMVSGPSAVSFGKVGAGAERVLKEGDDFVVLGFSGGGEVTAPLAFCGYSIHAGKGKGEGYATYSADNELEGKIAVILRFEPMDEKGESKWVERTADGEPEGGTPWSPASGISEKIQSAIRRGAVGVILVNPPGCADERSQTLETTRATTRWVRNNTLPAVQLTSAAADRLLRAADPEGRGLMEFRKRADEKGEVIDLPAAKVTLKTDIQRVPRTTWNIAGVLPGRGELADQYVIVGGHYDHVGYGYTGGSLADAFGIIHPGADDNASGASGVLLAADILKKRYEEIDAGVPLRSIMFIGFSAEEMGLIGSAHFVRNSPLSASAVYAMLNMDMIGRPRAAEFQLHGTGSAKGFKELLAPIVAGSGLGFEVDLDAHPGGMGPSDHATFFRSGVPVLHFFTGLHDQYHRPSDTYELIDCEGAMKVVRLVCEVASALQRRPEALEFDSGEDEGDDQPARRLPAPGGPSMTDMKVRFGGRPAYSDEGPGVLFEGVSENSSASEAGIKEGDRLMQWNGQDVADLRAFMEHLAKHSPGDVVEVTVKRGDEEKKLSVTLKARGSEAR